MRSRWTISKARWRCIMRTMPAVIPPTMATMGMLRAIRGTRSPALKSNMVGGDTADDGDDGDAQGHQGNEIAGVEVEHGRPPGVGVEWFASYAAYDRGRAGPGDRKSTRLN